MAKTTNNGAGPGQAEISVFAFSIKGDATVVQTALQTLAKQGVSFQQPPPPMMPKAPAVALPASNGSPAPASTPAEDVTAFAGDDEPVAAPTPAPKQAPRKRGAFAIPKLLDELRPNDGPVSFKDFVGTRSIGTDMQRVVVVATWLREHRGVDRFGINHLFTCYRMMGWTLPTDPGQPLRNAAKGKLQYLRPVGDGLYELTTGGQNKYLEIT